MKKIAFLLPLLILSVMATPLMAKSRFSFSFNLHSFLPPAPVVEEHVYVMPPPPCYVQREVIYPAPVIREEIIHPVAPYYPQPHCHPYYNHARPY